MWVLVFGTRFVLINLRVILLTFTSLCAMAWAGMKICQVANRLVSMWSKFCGTAVPLDKGQERQYPVSSDGARTNQDEDELLFTKLSKPIDCPEETEHFWSCNEDPEVLRRQAIEERAKTAPQPKEVRREPEEKDNKTDKDKRPSSAPIKTDLDRKQKMDKLAQALRAPNSSTVHEAIAKEMMEAMSIKEQEIQPVSDIKPNPSSAGVYRETARKRTVTFNVTEDDVSATGPAAAVKTSSTSASRKRSLFERLRLKRGAAPTKRPSGKAKKRKNKKDKKAKKRKPLALSCFLFVFFSDYSKYF